MIEYFKNNMIGKIIWACGLGKTLLSLFFAKCNNYKKVLFGVPSINLQIQIIEEIRKIFPDADILTVGSNNSNKNVENTTDIKKIFSFLNKENNKIKFVITTYHSSHLLINENINFNFKIGDEAHHLVGKNIINNDKNNESKEENNTNYKKFTDFHNINSDKTLFMTATEKLIKNDTINYSMDNENYFGEIIDSKSIKWAIDDEKITDYNVVIIKNTNEEIEEIINKIGITIENKRLFISAYISLKCFVKYDDLSHTLLYTNTQKDSELVKEYIDKLLEKQILNIDKNSFYNKALHCNNCKNINEEISEFKNSKYGIISCINIFGEGFNLKELNGVCVAGNMKSEIRIVQYLLRPNRLNKNNPNKNCSHKLIKIQHKKLRLKQSIQPRFDRESIDLSTRECSN